MSVTLSVQGDADVARALRTATGQVRSRVQNVVNRYANLVRREAKGLAPFDSGDLRGSIRVELERFAAQVIAGGGDVPYAAAVELGRTDLPAYPAQPFMGPAFETHRAAFVRDIRAAAGLTTGAA